MINLIIWCKYTEYNYEFKINLPGIYICINFVAELTRKYEKEKGIARS